MAKLPAVQYINCRKVYSNERRKKVNHKISRIGWIGFVLILATIACTFGLSPERSTPIADTAQSATPPKMPTSTPKEVSVSETPEVSADETEALTAVETTSALLTEVSAQLESPKDIPVYKPNQSFFGSPSNVSYITSATYKVVLDFYKKEMPGQGWTKSESDKSMETNSYAHLFYIKDARKAELTIFDNKGKISVLISIK
jgi:hypothetical protein